MAILDPNALNPGALSMGGASPFQIAVNAGRGPQSLMPTQAPPQPSNPFQASGGQPITPDPVAPVEGGGNIPPSQEPSVPHGVLGRLKDVGSRIGSGFMQEMSTPSGKKGLRAFGAAMLGAPNFWQGLSKGTTAFDETKDAEEALNKPKNAMVADGAFMASTDRNGNTTFSPNTDIQKYQTGLADAAFRSKLALQDDGQKSREAIAALMETGRNDRADDARASREGMAFQAGETRKLIAAMSAGNGRDKKPLSGRLQTLVLEHEVAANSLENAAADISGKMPSIKTIPFSAVNNALYQTQLSSGYFVSEEARKYGDFLATIKNLQATSLRLNKGVQTEPDAKRAMEEILAGKGDAKYIQDRLVTIQAGLKRQAQQERGYSNRVLRDNGRADLVEEDYSLPDDAYRDPTKGAGANNTPPPKGNSAPKGYGKIGNSFYAPPLVKAQMLQHQNNPEAIAAFDGRYGTGAAAAFIKQSKQK